MGKIRSCLVFKHLSFESFGTTQDSSKYHIKRNRGFVTPPANSQCNALTNSLQRCTVAKQYKAILSSDWHSFPTFYSTAQACHDVHTPRKKKIETNAVESNTCEETSWRHWHWHFDTYEHYKTGSSLSATEVPKMFSRLFCGSFCIGIVSNHHCKKPIAEKYCIYITVAFEWVFTLDVWLQGCETCCKMVSGNLLNLLGIAQSSESWQDRGGDWEWLRWIERTKQKQHCWKSWGSDH
jgi:hypothetical protein